MATKEIGMRIKGWGKFQHFKDRKPPWIKLYREVLDDLEWHELDDKSAKVLVMLWLIASEYDGELPDTKRLAFRLRMKEVELSSCIDRLSHWVERDDISAISERHRNDPLETETETEKRQKRDPALATPDGVSDDVWKAFLKVRKAKRAPMSELALAGIKREADAAGWTVEQALQECVTRGWQSFKADWVAAKNQTFAQHAADVARTTVPSKIGKDPALQRLEQDAANAAPVPPEIRERLAALRRPQEAM